MRTVTLLCALCLGGCAVFATIETMEGGLRALMGKKETEAVIALGEPTLRVRVGDKTVNVWSVTVSTPETQVSTGPGLTDYYVEAAREDSCEIRLVADREGTLIRSEHEGNNVGCMLYSQALLDYMRSRPKP